VGGLFLDNLLAWICAGLARQGDAEIRKNGDVRFPLPMLVLIGWTLSVPFLIWLATYFFRHEPHGWLLIVFGGFAAGWSIFCALYLPAEIVLTEKGITQRHWLRPDKHIAWPDVHASVIKDHYKRRAIQVTGSDAVKIVHSAYHVGQDRFLKEVTKRSHSDLLRLDT
jgi:hypothetical protein